jgi:putative endopeptidase
MKSRLLCSISLLAGLLAADAAQAEPEKTETAPAGKPQYGTWGFDSAGADMAKKAGDDFFRFANGAWLDRVQIPADKPAYSLRLAMTDLTEQRLHELIEEAAKKAEQKPATTEGKVGAFYKSFMDEARIEKAGSAALKDKLAEVRSAKTREALAALMGRQNSDFHGAIFAVGIDVDLKEPKRYGLSRSIGTWSARSRLLPQAGLRGAEN